MPHSPQQDGVERPQQIDRIGGHHAAVAEVVIRTPVEILKGKSKLVPPADLFEHAFSLRNDLDTDTVARNDGDLKRWHGIHNGSVKRKIAERQRVPIQSLVGQAKHASH